MASKILGRYFLYGSEMPRTKGKAHIYDNEISKSLCGVKGYWMEATTSVQINGDIVRDEGGISCLKFEEYFTCEKCKSKFKETLSNADTY